ncbi:MAG: VOC family protein [Pseudomonadota bacterium]|nr:VOC family protein [Pseudomonadota bacterium]
MTPRTNLMLCLGILALAGACGAALAEPAGHVTGIGGVFIKAKDPKALAAWYRDVLGLPLQPWGGAALRYDAPQHPPAAAWSAFAASSNYFAPSAAPFMIDYAVDDMDAILARLHAKGVEPLKRSDDDTSGKFAWILDPEGNKVELWEPKRAATP